MTAQAQHTELLPCPGCGIPADVHECPYPRDRGAKTLYVVCCAAGCSWSVIERTMLAAIKAWNRRAELSAASGAAEPIEPSVAQYERAVAEQYGVRQARTLYSRAKQISGYTHPAPSEPTAEQWRQAILEYFGNYDPAGLVQAIENRARELAKEKT